MKIKERKVKVKGEQKLKINLFTKYFVVFTLILFICMTVAGGLIMVFITGTTKREALDKLLTSVKEISEFTSNEFLNINLNDIDNNLISSSETLTINTLKNYSSTLNSDFFICNKQGKIAFCKETVTYKYPQNCPLHGAVQIDSDTLFDSNDESRNTYVGNLNGLLTDRHFIAIVPIYFNGAITGYVIGTQPISVGQTPHTSKVLNILIFSSFLALVLSMITVYFLTYSLTKPIRDMSLATRRYAKGEFSYRVPVRGNDEMSELITAFNSMANSLSILESSRRSFIGNVSHELKTPMTTIAGFIDGMIDGTISDEKLRQKYLRTVSSEVKRLSRVITSMLNMSKIEAGELKLVCKTYNLTDQIIHCLLSFEKLISDKDIQIIGLESMQSIQVYADEDMINQVIYNLIDNAVKFTPKEGIISFSAYIENSKALVKIKNSGVGIPIDDLRRVFERFYKVDKSRSLDTKSVGLGLYIVKSILELHDGYIAVASDSSDFVEFTFWIPLKDKT